MQYLIGKNYLSAIRTAEVEFKWRRISAGVYLSHENNQVRIVTSTSVLRDVLEGTVLWLSNDWTGNEEIDLRLVNLYIEIGKLVLAPPFIPEKS